MKTESQEQIKVIQWAKRQRKDHPEIRWLHHIPNGGARHITVASKLKLEGVESGVFDLFLPVARWDKHGLYIEMKRKYGKLSKNQEQFAKDMNNEGYAMAVVYDAEEGINYLKRYLGI